MSEEEILEIIEKLQCEYKEQQNDKKYNDYTVFKAKEYSKGLQGLLDLYNNTKKSELILANKFQKVNIELNKEKEKNKALKEELKYRINYCKLLEKELYANGVNYKFEKTEIEKQFLEE